MGKGGGSILLGLLFVFLALPQGWSTKSGPPRLNKLQSRGEAEFVTDRRRGDDSKAPIYSFSAPANIKKWWPHKHLESTGLHGKVRKEEKVQPVDCTLYARVTDNDKRSSERVPTVYQRFQLPTSADNHIDRKGINWYGHLPRISVAHYPFHFEGVSS